MRLIVPYPSDLSYCYYFLINKLIRQLYVYSINKAFCFLSGLVWSERIASAIHANGTDIFVLPLRSVITSFFGIHVPERLLSSQKTCMKVDGPRNSAVVFAGREPDRQVRNTVKGLTLGAEFPVRANAVQIVSLQNSTLWNYSCNDVYFCL